MNPNECKESDQNEWKESDPSHDQWTENNWSNGGLIITFKTEKESDGSEDETDDHLADTNSELKDPGRYCRKKSQGIVAPEELDENPQTHVDLYTPIVRIKEEPPDETETEFKTEDEILPDVSETSDLSQVSVKREPDTECFVEREFVSCQTENEDNSCDENADITRDYRCNNCHTYFDSKLELEYHIINKCSDGDNCDSRLREENSFNDDRLVPRLSFKSHDEKRNALDKTNKNYKVHGNCKPVAGKNYGCNLCGATFKCKSNVKVHQALKHSNDRKFECHICHARFKIKYILQKHINIKHSDVRNFSCSQCEAKFKTKFEVISHTRFKHTNERKFECDICLSKFKTKAHLEAHKTNTHSTVRNFRCDLCSASFKSKTALNRHLKYNSSKLHSNVQVYECPYCNMKFKAELPLKLHTALSHSKDKKPVQQSFQDLEVEDKE